MTLRRFSFNNGEFSVNNFLLLLIWVEFDIGREIIEVVNVPTKKDVLEQRYYRMTGSILGSY